MKKLFAKIFARTPQAKNLDWKNIQSVLVRPIGAGLGDAVVLSAVFNQLKQAYPKCKLGVLASQRNRPIFERVSSIDEIIPNTFLTTLTHCGKYQVFLDYQPTFTTRNILFDFFLAPSYTICFEKKAKKYYNANTVHCYNFYVPDLSAAHLSQSLSLTPFAPYVNTQHPAYTLTPPTEQSLQGTSNCTTKTKNIMVCPFGTDRQIDKKLLIQLLEKIAANYNVHFILPFAPEKYSLGNQLPLFYTGEISFEQFLTLFKQVSLCLSVDSAPVHIACAYHTPVLGFYSAFEHNFHVFSPIGTKALSVRSHTPANGPVKIIDNWSMEEAFEKTAQLLKEKK